MTDSKEIELIINFFLGVTTSLLAAGIVFGITVVRRKAAIRRLRGVWVEIRHKEAPNPNNFCFIELRYSPFRREYRMEGITYSDNFTFHGRWSSMNCSIEQRLGRVFYSYDGHNASSPFNTSHGFGFIAIRPRNKKIGFHDGYFHDVVHQSTPIPADYYHISSVTTLKHLKSLSDVENEITNPNSSLRDHLLAFLNTRH